MKEEFDKWIYEVCRIKSELWGRDVHDVYSMLEMTDAKLSFLCGDTPAEYVHSY